MAAQSHVSPFGFSLYYLLKWFTTGYLLIFSVMVPDTKSIYIFIILIFSFVWNGH